MPCLAPRNFRIRLIILFISKSPDILCLDLYLNALAYFSSFELKCIADKLSLLLARQAITDESTPPLSSNFILTSDKRILVTASYNNCFIQSFLGFGSQYFFIFSDHFYYKINKLQHLILTPLQKVFDH